jgi:hypothetical protein
VEEKIPRNIYLENKTMTMEQKMEKQKETLGLKHRMARQDRFN